MFNRLLRLVHDGVQKGVNNGSLQDPHHTWVLNNKDLPAAYGVSGGFIRRGMNDDFDPLLSDAIRMTVWLLDHDFPVTDHPTEREEKEYEKQRVELLLSLLDALLSDSEHISYHHRNLFSAPPEGFGSEELLVTRRFKELIPPNPSESPPSQHPLLAKQ